MVEPRIFVSGQDVDSQYAHIVRKNAEKKIDEDISCTAISSANEIFYRLLSTASGNLYLIFQSPDDYPLADNLKLLFDFMNRSGKNNLEAIFASKKRLERSPHYYNFGLIKQENPDRSKFYVLADRDIPFRKVPNFVISSKGFYHRGPLGTGCANFGSQEKTKKWVDFFKKFRDLKCSPYDF